jgi:hypothetical protein
LNIRQKICIRQNTKSEIYEKLVNSGYNLPPLKENGMTLDFLSGLLVDKYFIPKCDLVIEETKYNKQIIIYLLKVYIENDPNNTFQSNMPN